jgi:hypothetical protein
MITLKLTATYLKEPEAARTQAARIQYHLIERGRADALCEARGDHLLLTSGTAFSAIELALLSRQYGVTVEEMKVEGPGAVGIKLD